MKEIASKVLVSLSNRFYLDLIVKRTNCVRISFEIDEK